MDILAVTDARFLYEVFIAIGLVFSNGSFAGMIAVGLMLGLLFTMVRAWTTSKIEIQYVFIGFVIYLGFIVPKVSVDIEDLQNPTTVWTTPANVPLGVAVIGNLMSTISLNIVDVIETSFQTTSSVSGMGSQNGFMGSLKKLEVIAKSGGEAPDYLIRTLASYYADCTHQGLTAGTNSYEEILKSSDVLLAIRFDSDVFMTRVISASGLASNQTCTDAFVTIENWLDATSSTSVLSDWSSKLGDLTDERDASNDVFSAGSDMQNAVDSILGSTANAFDLAIASVVHYSVTVGDAEYAAKTNNITMIAMMTDATSQRNVDAYGAAIGFQQVMRPFSAFIEAFFFAITPIVAFLMMLGAYGISLMGKFLQLYAWIQMWTPMMAIVNFFINYRLKDAIDAATCTLGTACPFPQLDSLAAVDVLTNQVGHWLYVGNTMAAAVPVLALILVTGSVYSINSVATSMSGKDYTDEKKVAPDTFKTNAGKTQMGANGNEINSVGGVTQTYAPGKDEMGSLNLNNAATQQLQNTDSFMASRSAEIGNGLTETLKSEGITNQDGSINKQWQQDFKSQNGEVYSYANGTAKKLLSSAGIRASKDQTDSLTANIGAQMAVPGMEKLGFKASGGIIKQWAENNGIGNAAALGESVEQMLASDNSFSSNFQRTEGWSGSQSYQEKATQTFGKGIQKTVSDVERTSVTATNMSAATKALQRAASIGTDLSIADRIATALPKFMEANNIQDRGVAQLAMEEQYKEAFGMMGSKDFNTSNQGVKQLGQLLSYSNGFDDFAHLLPAGDSYEPEHQSIPGASDSVGNPLSTGMLDEMPGGMETLKDSNLKPLKKAEIAMGKGGAYERIMDEAKGNADLTPGQAKNKTRGIKEENDMLVNGQGFVKGLEHQEAIDAAFHPMILQEMQGKVGNNDLSAESNDSLALNLTEDVTSNIFESFGGQKAFNQHQNHANAATMQLVAFGLTQGEDAPLTAIDSTSLGDFGSDDLMNQSFTVNGDSGQSAGQIIAEAHAAAGGTDGVLNTVAQYTALNDHLGSKGIRMAEIPIGDIASPITGAGDMSSVLDRLKGTAGEISSESLQSKVDTNWYEYPSNSQELFAAPGDNYWLIGHEGARGQEANIAGMDLAGWSGGDMPVLAQGNRSSDPRTAKAATIGANKTLEDHGITDPSMLDTYAKREAYAASALLEALDRELE